MPDVLRHPPEIEADIDQLESLLANDRDLYTPDELRYAQEKLDQLRYVQTQWNAYVRTPVDETTGRTRAPYAVEHRADPGATTRVWRTFPAGTKTCDIEAWFQTAFCVDVEACLRGSVVQPHERRTAP